MKKLYNTYLLISLGLTVVIHACTFAEKAVDPSIMEEVLPEDIVEMRDDQIRLADIELGYVKMQSLGNTLKVNGIISAAPQNVATVCMPMGGFIKNTTLFPGINVKKGQTLALIENQDFIDIQQNYLETKNKLVFAEAEYNRHTDLFKDDVYSEQNVQQVTVEYRNQKAMLKSLEQKLLMIGLSPGELREDNISSTVSIVSPISGYLKAVNINIGKYVSPTDVLFEIVNSDKLFLELGLFEKDADKVLAGQDIRFYINNETDEHKAVVTQTGKSVSDDKIFRIYASVTSSCKNLLPGMYVNAYISENDNEVTSLPSEAVVSFDDKDYIFIYERDKEEAGMPFTEYKMIEVVRGIKGDGYTEVILPEKFDIKTSKVVTKGAYNLLSAKKNAGEMAC